MVDYQNNLKELISEVEQARLQYNKKHIVKIVAVSKYSTASDIKSLYLAGQRAFGENKIQDLISKQNELNDLPIEWHFIGRLQKNKINHLIDANVSLFHSLDSLELALEIEKRLTTKNKSLNTLLQINSAYEESKAGVGPENAYEIYTQIEKTCPHIHLKGVMSIGAHTDKTEDIIKSFNTTKTIYNRLNCDILSMGMSSDYPLAIQSGSNLIRVGSALFK